MIHERWGQIVLGIYAVLPYLEKPIEFIDQLKFYSFDIIIIDRNAFIEEKKDILTVQIVPEFIYKASYPAWFFNEQNFKDQFTDKYELKMEFMSPFALPSIVNDKKVYWKGFLFKKKI